MHFITFVSTFLLVGAGALPQLLGPRQDPQHDQHAVPAVAGEKTNVAPFFLSAVVQKAIDDLLKTWHDPYELKSQTIDISLPDGSVHIIGIAKDVTVAGFSAIEIKTINWRLFPPTLTFHFYLHELYVSAELFEGHVTYFDQIYKVAASGWVAFKDVHIAGNARLSLGSPITVRDVAAELSFSSVESQLVVHLAGVDCSNQANDFIHNSLHDLSVAHNDFLNSFLRSLLQGLL